VLSSVSRSIITALLVTGAVGPAGWRNVPPPAVPHHHNGNLDAMWMSGPSSGWVGGFVLGTGQRAQFEPLLARLVDHRWQDVKVPMGNAVSGRINGLAGSSATDVWAVGQASTATRTTPLIDHWNGKSWSRVPAPGVPGYPFGDLLGVAAASPDDAWAVGEAQNNHQQLHTVIEHWNGHSWQLTASPPDGSLAALTAVTATPDGQAWAVAGGFGAASSGFVLHWTGHKWVTQSTPTAGADVYLGSVAAISPRDVWAVGVYALTSGGLRRPYALHWNGQKWALVKVPNPGPKGDERNLTSVTVGSGGQVTAVGYDPGSPTHLGNALYANWRDGHWTVTNGTENGTALFAVSAAGRATWAAGAIDPNPTTFLPVTQVSG
jgi:hypothetical protein